MRASKLFQHASVVVGAGLSVLAVGALPAQAASVPRWSLTTAVGSASPGTTSFGDFVVTGQRDAWLGATSNNTITNKLSPVIEHWNGTSWRQVSLTPPAGFKVISALGAASSRDAWALSQTDRHVALHWNGVAWRAVSTPIWVERMNRSGTYELEVAVFGPHDVLAFSLGTGDYAAHYNGTRWTRMRLPGVAGNVRAVSRADIWLQTASRIEHWNGHSWRKVTLPKVHVPRGSTESVGLLPSSGRDSLWLQRTIQKGSSSRTLYWQHWNGKKWSRVYPPSKVAAFTLTPDGHGGYWTEAQGPAPAYRNYFYHRSAAGHWTRQAAPGTATVVPGNVRDVARVPGTTALLAVGQATDPASGAVTAGPFLALWQNGKP